MEWSEGRVSSVGTLHGAWRERRSCFWDAKLVDVGLFFFALPLGGVLFCELFELLFFLLIDAAVFTLIENVSRVEGAVVGVVFAQHHREVRSGVFLCERVCFIV